MKKSVSETIYQFLKDHEGEYHAGFEFVNRTINGRFCGSSADRKCRLMAENGLIEKKYDTINGVRYAFYRVKPIEKPVENLVHSSVPKQLSLQVK